MNGGQLKFPGQRGTALLIVLWVIAVLSFLLVTSMMVMMQSAETGHSRNQVLRARQLAEMGVALAVHPQVKPWEPMLKQQVSEAEAFEAIISTEESRLNLNIMLTEERLPILEDVLIGWGMTEVQAETLIDSLMDWVDADDARRLKGAERPEYEEVGMMNAPFNRRFQTLDQVQMVLGIEALMEVQPGWRDQVTLLGSGQLDVNEASAELLAAVANVPFSAAESVVRERAGADGLAHTVDDTPYESVEKVLDVLGVGESEAEMLAPLLTVKGKTLRVISLGKTGDYVRGISVVFEGSGDSSKMLEWREFVP